MLEVLNLKKVYKSKTGSDVAALDGVTLRFPEKGMVFLLGKSGSGKSTLLNVCGGLDSPTSGEIVVKGRSSKNFSQSDFDSYRNTYIGFIFQEYNILNEFSVEDNIALALELQGKPKDKAAINKLLEEVDLVGYAKRKPNTLSGGQKQRIAIARALIKSPEIIMADEPTGALDSNTGKQVFETLKKLSKDKLVIVVSHDREFAELYGDRIIELKDGKVLSDVEKTEQGTSAVSENIDAIGNILCIKNGADLNETDFDKIKAFLKKAKKDIVIASDESDIKAFKKASRINENGSREVFAQTDENKNPRKQYTPADSRFIRSKLPARHAFKIGASSLKNKPIRLIFTVLLCTVAFVMFGLLSTLSFYNSEETFKQSLTDSGKTIMLVQKDYQYKETYYFNGKQQGEFFGNTQTRLTENDIKSLSEKFGSDTFGAVRAGITYNIKSTTSEYWVNRIDFFAALPETNSLRQNLNGTYPTNKDEIIISSYTADVIATCGLYSGDGESLELKNPTDIIGKKIDLGGIEYKVTGIFDSGKIDSKYDYLKETEAENYMDVYNFTASLEDGLHLVAFVTPDRLSDIENEDYYFTPSAKEYTYAIAVPKGQEMPEHSNVSYVAYSSLQNDNFYYFSDSAQYVPNAVYLTNTMFGEYVADAYREKLDNAHNSDNGALVDRYNNTVNLAYEIMQGGIWDENADTKDNIRKFTPDQMKQKITSLISALNRDNIKLEIDFRLYDMNNGSALGEISTYPVAGVYLSNGESYNNYFVIHTDEVYKNLWDTQKASLEFYSEYDIKYVEPKDAIYDIAFAPFNGSAEQTDDFWQLYSNNEFGEDSSRVTLTGAYVNNIKMVDDFVLDFTKIFLYVGIGFALFAVLLFSNFISVSISQKKREIGILRAVGARSTDVFKIFFSESFVIAAICTVIATVLSVFLCGVINGELNVGIGASLFVFGIPSFAVLLGSALLTAVIATFLPVFNAARKKPVESIRAL